MGKKIADEEIWAWVAGRNMSTVEKIFERAGLNFGAFLASARDAHGIARERYRRKNFSGSQRHEDMGMLALVRLDHLQKRKKMRQQPMALRIEREYHLIKKLRDNKASWAEVAQYLATHCNVEISPSYIYKVMRSLDEKQR